MRCKVTCSFINPANKPEDGSYVHFSPVVDGSEENKEFFKWTPGGQIVFSVLNPAAVANFEQGKQYYVDFSPAS